MIAGASPIPDFVSALGGGDLSDYLAADIRFEVPDLPVMEGRQTVLRLWRRPYQSYTSVEVSLLRHVPDGDLVLAEQRQMFTPLNRPAIQLQSIVLYTLKDGQIATWSDHLELDAMPGEDRALWRRLWAARW